MARTDRCIILQNGKKNLNFDTKKILKSGGSSGRCRESFKLHNHETGQVCGSRVKTFEEGEADDSALDDTLRKEELLDTDNCMWLSSGGASSPSSCYQYDGFFGCKDFKREARLISLLGAVLSTQATFFDGSKVNPMEEASLVLDKRKVLDEDACVQEKLEEEEVVSWLAAATENESPDSLSATCFEGDTESSSGHCSVKWTSKIRSELELDVGTPVGYGFSSITDRSDENSLCSSSFNSGYSSEVMDLEEFGTDKPLVWPSNWAADWGSGTKWDFFIMSPRKDLHKVGNSTKDTSCVVCPRVPNGKSDLENSCTKGLVFGTRSNSRDCLDVKNTNGVTDGRKTRSYPSRRRKSTKTSTKIVPFPSVDDFETPTEAKVAYKSESTDTFEGFSDTRWISDKSSELANTRSSSAASDCKSLQLSTSGIYSVSDITDEHMLLSSSSSSDRAEDTRTKTPVFWPSSCASGWGSNTKWDSFVMSPRKDIYKNSNLPKTSLDSLRLQAVNGNKDVEKGCSRRLEFSGDSKPLTSTTSCTKTVATEQPEIEALTKKPMTKHKIVLEDLLLVDKLNIEGSIEQVLGLSEFDGHEGIESEFNKDEFHLV